MSFQPPKGTFDVVPGANQPWRRSASWRRVLAEWDRWAALYGYPLVMTPLFESTELFLRGVGDTTEVVSKQMYTFTDRGGRSVTLRPEGTAGVVRAFLDSGAQGVWKAAYSGPMFRYERPQRGRFRQFWQVGVEVIDAESPVADAEVIELGYRYLSALGVPGLEIRLNSLGDEVCRPQYLEVLRSYLESVEDRLCDDSRRLVQVNPLRVLDCSVCGPVIDPPGMVDHLCDPCREHFDRVLSLLDDLKVPYRLDPRLVRGLDYYTRTAFEYVATNLEAAQNAVGGGGRYDGLAESIGGRPAPGVGFALGVDRIILTIDDDQDGLVDLYLVSETGPDQALEAVSALRSAGLSVDFDTEGRSVKAQFRAAGRSGARATLIFRGPEAPVELRAGETRVEMRLGEVRGWLEGRE
jgi:histidyl-tRNA synthetase